MTATCITTTPTGTLTGVPSKLGQPTGPAPVVAPDLRGYGDLAQYKYAA